MEQLSLISTSTEQVPQKELASTALATGRAMARALAEEQAADEDRLRLSRAFCHRLIAAFWNAQHTDLGLRPFWQDLELAELPAPATTLAEELGTAVAAHDVERAFYEIGLVYNVMLPPGWRSRFGVYYTPPELTRRLVEQAGSAGVDWRTCRVLDPACGGGAFLAPVAKRMLDALGNCEARLLVQNVTSRTQGFEIDPFAAWMSQVALDTVLLPHLYDTGDLPPRAVSICDTLSIPAPDHGYDLVIGNPPYGRIRLAPEQRRHFKRSLYGHANLYGVFTDIALRQVRQDGVVSFVTPTSFLAGGYFRNLRTLLSSEAVPICMDFVDQRKGVFEDVLQETLLATYRKGAPRDRITVCSVEASPGTLQASEIGHFELPHSPEDPWLIPRTSEQASLIERMNGMPARLVDWGYRVSTGPLVWNRHKQQLCEREGTNTLPLIWAEAVTGDGRFHYRAEKRNHKPLFRIGPGDEWLITRAPCVLVQRTTAKEQNRRLVAAALPDSFVSRHGGVVIENHLNMLRPTSDRPPVSVTVLAAFLNSRIADSAFRCVSGSVAVSAFELEALPLPAPDDLHELEKLIADGASRQEIDAACTHLYGFPAE